MDISLHYEEKKVKTWWRKNQNTEGEMQRSHGISEFSPPCFYLFSPIFWALCPHFLSTLPH